MSRFARYKNGFGYRYNKTKCKFIPSKYNVIYHYLRTNISKDIIEDDILLVPHFNSISILASKNKLGNCTCSYIRYNNKDNYLILCDYLYLSTNNIDVYFVIFHEMKHILIYKQIGYTEYSLQEEIDCDKYASDHVGIDIALDSLKKLYKTSKYIYGKIDLQERIEALEEYEIINEIKNTIF